MNNIDFFFDFMSPFGYLAHQRLPQLADKFGHTLTYKPIDLSQAKLAAGNTGPANRQIPAKIRYLLGDLQRWAQAYGVPFKVPDLGADASPRANMGTFFALERGQAREYVRRVWHAWFGVGTSVSIEDLLGDVAVQMGWPAVEFLDFTQSEEARRRFALTNDEAHERGVFGVPTMMIGQEMWWGNDRLDFLNAHLEAADSGRLFRRGDGGHGPTDLPPD